MTLQIAALILIAYFLGSLPIGVWVSRANGVDILKTGSGNPGATNVWRTLGAKAGSVVFVLDTLKGVLPAVLARWLVPGDDGTWSFLAGLFAVVGHSLSPFLRFRGGKGVATGFGALLGSAPLVGLSAFAVFLVTVLITRYISLGSILACVALLGFGILFNSPLPVLVLYALLGAFVALRHRDNIVRLMRGEERKFSLSKKPTAPETVAEPSEP